MRLACDNDVAVDRAAAAAAKTCGRVPSAAVHVGCLCVHCLSSPSSLVTWLE